MTEAAAELSRTTTKKEDEDDDDLPHDAPGEATLLVSEFPPPPFYYPLADQLEPPPIPTEALRNGTERAARAMAEARAEAERQRLGDTNAILGGTVSQEEDDNVVAVFGEVVEDPWLVRPLDLCEDPTVVRDEVKRLNATVLQLFAQLAQDLVHRPLENKYV
jgi:mediator of RNA polymerase II transcription subunit 7